MSEIKETVIDIDGVPTHVLQGGAGERSILFIHGGMPGVSPYSGGTHLWEGTLEDFASGSRVAAFDMLGCGGTGWRSDGGPITIDDLGRHSLGVLEALDLPDCHVVGHDAGGLVALWLAMNAPQRMRSISIVASAAAAPTGDWLDDIVYNDPPLPLLGRRSQEWAIDRVSFDRHHVTPALIEACVTAAERPGPRAASLAMAGPQARALLSASMSRTKGRAWALSRDSQLAVPFQIIWAASDPLTTPAHGQTLFQTLGRTQPEGQFHLVNRSGSFVFREQPQRFRRLVDAFRDGLAATTPNHRYA